MGKTVLIVEDEKAIVEIVKFNLQREGYSVLEALDGEAGLELAQAEDPDLILLDVMLPRMNGFDVCRTLRAGGCALAHARASGAGQGQHPPPQLGYCPACPVGQPAFKSGRRGCGSRFYDRDQGRRAGGRDPEGI